MIKGSYSISKFFARAKPSLLGSDAYEESQVDMWLEYLRFEVWTRCRILNLHLFGFVQLNKIEHEFITKELKEHLKNLNAQIKGKSFIVGKQLTIADVWCAIVL